MELRSPWGYYIKCLGLELTDITSAHNSLATTSYMAFLNHSGIWKCVATYQVPRIVLNPSDVPGTVLGAKDRALNNKGPHPQPS